MKFTISKITNNKNGKPVKGCSVALSVENKYCLFLKDDQTIYKLFKPTVTDISANGIVINGFEENGCTNKGNRKYKYVEWFCAYESLK